MPTQKEVLTWVRRFKKAYPEALDQRLAWWEEMLGIDRGRMLALLEFRPEDVERLRQANWREIAEEAGENGRWVDGLLRELLSRYHYNWHAMSSELHDSTRSREKEKTRITRTAGSVEHLPYVPPEGRDHILLNHIAAGGPQALSSLVEYLSGE